MLGMYLRDLVLLVLEFKLLELLKRLKNTVMMIMITVIAIGILIHLMEFLLVLPLIYQGMLELILV